MLPERLRIDKGLRDYLQENVRSPYLEHRVASRNIK